jgi:hypothetical protein
MIRAHRTNRGFIEVEVGMSQESPQESSYEAARVATRRTAAGSVRTLGSLGVLFALCAGLTGCGLAAAPCRIASAGLKIVPVVGHVAAAPTDACADVIDP